MTPMMTSFKGPFAARNIEGLDLQPTSQFSISPSIIGSKVINDVYEQVFEKEQIIYLLFLLTKIYSKGKIIIERSI